MNKIVLFLFSMLVSNISSAWIIQTNIVAGEKGQLKDQVTLYCRPEEPYCTLVCDNNDVCVKEQELCYNCLGTVNPILRTVFTEIDRLYINTFRTASLNEIIDAYAEGHIYVAAKSIFNFFSAIDNSETLMRFRSLCPTTTSNPIVVLKKNKNNEPTQIKYIICEGEAQYDQDMYILAYDPQVEVDSKQP